MNGKRLGSDYWKLISASAATNLGDGLLVIALPWLASAIWEKAVAAPIWQGARRWLHGDLHPANVVVRDGTLAGAIDFGDVCAGDPATDLSAAWILLPAGAASRFFDAYGLADEATVTRARGWAVLRGSGSHRDRTEREARSGRRQIDLGTGRLRHARTGPRGELTRDRPTQTLHLTPG